MKRVEPQATLLYYRYQGEHFYFFIIYSICLSCPVFRGFFWNHWPRQFVIAPRSAVPASAEPLFHQCFVLLLEATGDARDPDEFPLGASWCFNAPLFRFYFRVVSKLPNTSSPEHISVVFTGSDRRRGQSFGADGAVFWIQPHASLARGMIHQMSCSRLVFSVALSVWIYLLEWCHQKLCGIIHHLDRNNSYESVLMQLTDAGGSRQPGRAPDATWED